MKTVTKIFTEGNEGNKGQTENPSSSFSSLPSVKSWIYRAPHSTDGHADRCTALALALRASDGSRAANLAREIEICLEINRRLEAERLAPRNPFDYGEPCYRLTFYS